STFATPRTPSVPKILFSCATSLIERPPAPSVNGKLLISEGRASARPRSELRKSLHRPVPDFLRRHTSPNLIRRNGISDHRAGCNDRALSNRHSLQEHD